MLLTSPDSNVMKRSGMSLVYPAQIVLDTDGLYLLNYGVSPWWSIISMQFGLVGMAVYNSVVNRKIKQKQMAFEMASPEAIVAEDPKSFYYAYQSIEKFAVKNKLWHGWRGQKAVYIWVDGIEHRLYFPKDLFQTAQEILSGKLAGKEN